MFQYQIDYAKYKMIKLIDTHPQLITSIIAGLVYMTVTVLIASLIILFGGPAIAVADVVTYSFVYAAGAYIGWTICENYYDNEPE